MRYRFADCEIDTEALRLTVAGEVRTVEPQVFDLIRHLVENPGRVVSRDELIQSIWGGRIVSDSAISARISAARAAIGDDGARQGVIATVPRRGFRLAVEPTIVENPDAKSPRPADPSPSSAQRVRVCTSRDGTRIAYASSGTGAPFVRAGHWLTHLEHDWKSPVWRPFLDELGRSFQVTRYDQRGNGLSDWTATDFTLERFVEDLEAVVDAADLDRFTLYGTSQGSCISIAYALRHPERVSRLILHGGYVQGRLLRGSAEERDTGLAMLTLIRHSWGKPGSAFLKSFAATYVPGGTREQIDSLAELQRLTTSAENAAALREAVDRFDVIDLLGQLSCPTLVLHSRNDGVHPIEQGRALAAGIPGAEFVTLDSDSHVILMQDPAWHVLFEELRRFAAP